MLNWKVTVVPSLTSVAGRTNATVGAVLVGPAGAQVTETLYCGLPLGLKPEVFPVTVTPTCSGPLTVSGVLGEMWVEIDVSVTVVPHPAGMLNAPVLPTIPEPAGAANTTDTGSPAAKWSWPLYFTSI